MSIELEKKLNEKFQDYLHFLHGGSAYSAIQKLGEIFNCLPMLSRSKQMEWIEQLRNERLSEATIDSVKSKIENDIKSIERIVSVGSKFIVEEFVLILTSRIQIELVLDLLQELGFDEIKVESDEIDDKITRISQVKENKEAFKDAISLLKKNWGVPITSKWFNVNSFKKESQ